MTGLEGVEQINAVTRRVGSGEFRAGEARMVTIGRRYDAPIEDVWDACTNPERIPRWFLPVSGELHEGGRYQVQGNAGGVIERCEPPRGFAATWEFGGQVSWIELRLSEEAVGLTKHLVTGAVVDREAGLAFPATDEGRRFVEASSRGWCEAAIASGADPAEATAAAERTFAFFTGAGPAA